MSRRAESERWWAWLLLVRVDELETTADARRRARGQSASAVRTGAAYAAFLEALHVSAEAIATAAERTGPH